MRVVIITDTHGCFRQLVDKYKSQLYGDLVLVLGDLSRADAQLVDSLFNVPILVIHGNHDIPDTYTNTNMIDLHLQLVEAGTALITGFQGSSKYKPLQSYGYTQDESKDECIKIPRCDILMCHDGPLGYCGDIHDDAHSGLIGIRNYIEQYKPSLVFFGHHHKNRHFQIGPTDCYNIYEIGIFDIVDNKVVSYRNYNL